MTESKLSIPEMSCDACRATIEGALGGLPGVAAVTVDLDRKLVTVEHDDQHVPVARLAAAVEDQGYLVTAAEAP